MLFGLASNPNHVHRTVVYKCPILSNITVIDPAISTKEKKSPDSVIKTAGRVLEIFEYFRDVRGPLSVREISERFGYPLSSTAVLVKSLTTLGYLTYDSKIRSVFPTIRIALIGDWLYDAMHVGGHLLSLMEDVCRETGETAILAIQNDIYSQYVHIMPNRNQVIQLNVPIGTRRLLCWSGTGWAMLGQQADETIVRLIERTQLRMGQDPIAKRITKDAVFDQVRLVRKNGYALSNRTVTDGAGTIAMALPVAANGMRMAIAAGGVADRLLEKRRHIVKVMSASIKTSQAGSR